MGAFLKSSASECQTALISYTSLNQSSSSPSYLTFQLTVADILEKHETFSRTLNQLCCMKQQHLKEKSAKERKLYMKVLPLKLKDSSAHSKTTCRYIKTEFSFHLYPIMWHIPHSGPQLTSIPHKPVVLSLLMQILIL